MIFSAVYILSAFSYFNQNYPMLLASLLLWVMMVPVDSLSYIISWICSCINIIKEKESGSIGIAVRNSENEYYTIQVSKTDKHENLLNSISDQIFVIKTDSDSYSIGIATGKTNLIESIWIDSDCRHLRENSLRCLKYFSQLLQHILYNIYCSGYWIL